MGQQRTVQTFAAERGRSVEEVLAACRGAGVVAWSAFTPLDDDEASAIGSVLAASALPAPPPATRPGDLPPPTSPPIGQSAWPPQPAHEGPSASRILGTIAAVLGLIVVVCLFAVALLGTDEQPRFEAVESDLFAEVGDAATSCVDLLVESVNDLDLDSIDVGDGLDDGEWADLDARLTAAEDAHPEAQGGDCESALDDPATALEFESRVDPGALAALVAMSQGRFQEIGEAIPVDPSAPADPTEADAERAGCVELLAVQINAIDVSAINPDDGLDEDELADLQDQRAEFAAVNPSLQPGGVCLEVAPTLTPEETARLVDLVDPDKRVYLEGL